jgi:large subunit ribosomal protein L24
MDNGRLAVPQGNAEVTIAAGQIHLTKALWRAQNGAEVSLDGTLDLNDATVDAHMTLSAQPPANALIPGRAELTIAVKGPLTAPERRLDVSTLVARLTLRAAELQTRRVESLEANRREEVRGSIVRPVSPAIRFIPMGTALETTDHVGASASAPSGRTLDHLQPEVPVPMPVSRPDHGATAAPLPSANGIKPAAPHPAPAADKTTANAGTADPDRGHSAAPQPALHSPLDLLFHSQN